MEILEKKSKREQALELAERIAAESAKKIKEFWDAVEKNIPTELTEKEMLDEAYGIWEE